jgi:hypothetical protein
MGDFNDHTLHSVYDMAHNLGLRQHVKEPTHIKGRVLDMTFTDNDDATVSVLSKAKVADHFPIMMTVPDDLIVMQGPKRKFWDYQKADWKSLWKYVRSHLSHDKLHTLTIDAAVAHLDDVLSQGMQLHIPSQVRHISVSSVPWFDDDCYAAMMKAQSGGPTEQTAYNNTVQLKQVEYKCKIRNRIRGMLLSQRQFWNMARCMQGATVDRSSRVPPMKKGDHLVTDTAEKCSDFAEAFITKATLPDRGEFIPRPGHYCDINDFTFTKEDVYKWLSGLVQTKAAGPNAISPRIYQHLARELSGPMHTIYSRMLKLGQWPVQWRQSAL